MYHCHMRLYFTGRHQDMFAPLREIAPLEPFTHIFLELSLIHI